MTSNQAAPTGSRRSLSSGLIVLLAIVSMGLTGCGSGSPDESRNLAQTVTTNRLNIVSTRLEENNGYIHIRGTGQFYLTGINNQGEEIDITSEATWRVSDRNLANVSRGLVTPAGTAGTVTLTAEFAGQVHTQQIDISNANLVSIEVSAAQDTVDVCRNAEFSAAALFDNGLVLTYPLTWKVVENTGLARFPDPEVPQLATYQSGVVTLVAEGKNNADSVVQSSPLTFPIADTLVDITLEAVNASDNLTLREGQNLTFVATATYAGGASADITKNASLSISPSSAGTLDPETGIFTANSGSYDGTQVTVTGRCDNTTAELVVTVLKPQIQSIEIRSDAGSADNFSINEGTTTTLSVTATFADEAGADADYQHHLEWEIDQSASDNIDTDLVTIDEDGRLEASGDLNLNTQIRVRVRVSALNSEGDVLSNPEGEELTDTIDVFINPL